MKKKNGFTLAETLVTLLIIGVVAAITIPALISGYQDRQFNSAKQKAKTTLANGYKKMISAEVMKFEDMPIFKCNNDFQCLKEAHAGIFNVVREFSGAADNLPERYSRKTGNSEAAFSWRDVPYGFQTADGTIYGLVFDVSDNSSFSVVIDLNGAKGPNRALKDLAKFRIDRNGGITDVSSELDEDYTGFSSGYSSYWTTPDPGFWTPGWPVTPEPYWNTPSGYDVLRPGPSGYDYWGTPSSYNYWNTPSSSSGYDYWNGPSGYDYGWGTPGPSSWSTPGPSSWVTPGPSSWRTPGPSSWSTPSSYSYWNTPGITSWNTPGTTSWSTGREWITTPGMTGFWRYY